MNKFAKTVKILDNIFSVTTNIKKRLFFCLHKSMAVLYYSDGLVDKITLDEYVLRPLGEGFCEKLSNSVVKNRFLQHCEIVIATNHFELCQRVFEGETMLLVDGISEGFSLNTKKWNVRAIAEPPTSTVIKGPREGFSEDFQQNLSLIKRKIKSHNLSFEMLKIGKYSNTPVAITYIVGVVNKSVLKKVRNILNKIEIDGTLDSSFLVQYLESNKFSIFKQVGDTEKPDIFTSRLLEGRVGILVDGSPIVLTLPFMALEDLQSPSDYYGISFKGTFTRCLRLLAFISSLLMPSLYVAAQLFHNQFLPLNFLLTISQASKGIPLSPSLEMFFVLFVFQVLNEASIRMPKYVGMAMSVVGALVLGDTAVRAGIVSTPAILIVAISALGLYTIPDEQMSLSILRFAFLMVGGIFGIVGIIGLFLGIVCYLSTLENFGTPYFAPFAPKIKSDLSDGIFKSPLALSTARPTVLKSPNKRRVDLSKFD